MARSLYIKLDVDYHYNAKIISAGEKAEVLYIRALCLAKQMSTDGLVNDVLLPRIGLSNVKGRAKSLVDCGLWKRCENGYMIVGYAERNLTNEEIEEAKKTKRLQGQHGNHVRYKDPQSDCVLCFPKGTSETSLDPSLDPSSKGSSDPLKKSRQSKTESKSKVDTESELDTESESESKTESGGGGSVSDLRELPVDNQPTTYVDTWNPGADVLRRAYDEARDPTTEGERFQAANQAKRRTNAEWDKLFGKWLDNLRPDERKPKPPKPLAHTKPCTGCNSTGWVEADDNAVMQCILCGATGQVAA